MLISTNRPPDITPSLIGTGAAWLSSDTGAALFDGLPGRATRIQWLSGAQTTNSTLTIQATWATAIVPRIVALLGLTLPVGTLISLAFKRPADTGYTYATTYSQRVVQLPDGSRCAWFVLADSLDAVEGIQWLIHNDVDGVASIAADSAVDVGEAWVGGASYIPHQQRWSRGLTDPSIVRRTLGGQPRSAARQSWRTLDIRCAPVDGAAAFDDGLTNGEDWSQIEAALIGAAPCAIIPRLGAADLIQRTALYAQAGTQGRIQHLGGDWFDRDYTFAEIPAKPA